MAKAQASETVTRLALERERDDELVMAESSLIGERVVSIVRLFMLLLFGVSLVVPMLMGTFVPRFDLIRVLAVGAYLIFFAVTAVIVSRAKSNATGALLWPFLFIFFDYGFIVTMGWRRWVVD